MSFFVFTFQKMSTHILIPETKNIADHFYKQTDIKEQELYSRN